MKQLDIPRPGQTGPFTTDDVRRQRLRKDPHTNLPLLKAACLTSADGKTSCSIYSACKATPINAAYPRTQHETSVLLQHISLSLSLSLSLHIHAMMVSADVFWYSRLKRNYIPLNIQATHIWCISLYTKLRFHLHNTVYIWTTADTGNNLNNQHRNRIASLSAAAMWFSG
jgi:hypothetical protein